MNDKLDVQRMENACVTQVGINNRTAIMVTMDIRLARQVMGNHMDLHSQPVI